MIGEQYSTFEQEHATAEFGMWVFLATELMLFGGLFTVYTVYRTLYSVAFAEGSHHLNLVLGVSTRACCWSAVSPWPSGFARHSSASGGRWCAISY
jgi:heme/copper-type cytochrome/quinol oxidase subunit 3